MGPVGGAISDCASHALSSCFLPFGEGVVRVPKTLMLTYSPSRQKSVATFAVPRCRRSVAQDAPSVRLRRGSVLVWVDGDPGGCPDRAICGTSLDACESHTITVMRSELEEAVGGWYRAGRSGDLTCAAMVLRRANAKVTAALRLPGLRSSLDLDRVCREIAASE